METGDRPTEEAIRKFLKADEERTLNKLKDTAKTNPPMENPIAIFTVVKRGYRLEFQDDYALHQRKILRELIGLGLPKPNQVKHTLLKDKLADHLIIQTDIE